MFDKLLIPIEEYINKNYYILFSDHFKKDWFDLLKQYNFSKYVIITDDNVYHFYKNLINQLENELSIAKILIRPAGEEFKHLKYTQEVFEDLIRWEIDRKSCIIALGGGVIGDFAGFIASTILRGIAFIQIPTTLLAMVDSSVGGKVAVNVDIGKNMVGSFYQPKVVLCNIDFLNTLPDKEWICGLAEIVKHSLLNKHVYQNFKNIVWNHPDYKKWDFSLWNQVIYESIKVKAEVVSKDEKESGLRSILNLGHTVAHAIESLTNYKVFSHGEAVSRGLVTALLLSKKKFQLSEEIINEVFKIMQLLKLPLDTADLDGSKIAEHLVYDKKNLHGKIKYIYLEDIGKPVYDQELDINDFLVVWQEQKKLFG
ncbi:MAG: 3-dehydroquinate synthase [Leptospiraceae bacterium]|nr:MAG: 3-dehydroquinate synthase [Leptospiraceae bacterium]